MFNILTYILMIAFMVMLTTMIVVIFKYVKTKKRLKEMQEEILKLKEEYKSKASTYSNNLLEYIKTFSIQLATIKFHNFVDTHEMEKVTRLNVEKLVEETAKFVKNSINENNIIFDNALFTKDFYDTYIIDTVSICIKDLLERYVENS